MPDKSDPFDLDANGVPQSRDYVIKAMLIPPPADFCLHECSISRYNHGDSHHEPHFDLPLFYRFRITSHAPHPHTLLDCVVLREQAGDTLQFTSDYPRTVKPKSEPKVQLMFETDEMMAEQAAVYYAEKFGLQLMEDGLVCLGALEIAGIDRQDWEASILSASLEDTL
jgi:hypothetical protein